MTPNSNINSNVSQSFEVSLPEDLAPIQLLVNILTSQQSKLTDNLALTHSDRANILNIEITNKFRRHSFVPQDCEWLDITSQKLVIEVYIFALII